MAARGSRRSTDKGQSMALTRYLEAASGLTTLTKGNAERIVKQLVKQGEAAAENATELVEDLLERQRTNREGVQAFVRSETLRAVKALGLATSDEVERLQKQVADLKRELAKAKRDAAGKGAAAASTKRGGAAKKSSAKKAAKTSTAKKSSTKKAARTSTATKAAAKKTSTTTKPATTDDKADA